MPYSYHFENELELRMMAAEINARVAVADRDLFRAVEGKVKAERLEQDEARADKEA